ncbi:RNA polymerase factor sigma-54 [Paracrocinitomix mangrovi]|uniref:RNA polymerase factor sigma-54 n=1 Tax=Paracrocinitomix mangrovi TaxID=2862509 RepID=UPI001C8E8A9A|nr:RNA polymerase factor sigma-54 [Paracrocinitomix mangrovi]UKN00839.1 RNA polymerase factor sigma-54 [Paracrocinitomix mangrovi]
MLRQQLSQKLLQKLSPQQIQLMKLLQVPTMELEQRIKEEIEENPALEEGKEDHDDDYGSEDDYNDDLGEVSESQEDFDINDYLDDDLPQYKTSVSNQGRDDDDKAVPISGGVSFHEILKDQLMLRKMTDKERVIAENIIGNIDDDGYLRREIEAIVDDLAFTQNVMCTEEEVEDVLFLVQDLEPAGVGARDLRECLLLQLERRHHGNIAVYTAKKILEKCFEEFTKKHYDKIKAKFEISDEDLKDAVDEITKLNPKPGNSLKESTNSKNIQQIIPDFILTEEEGELSLSLNSRNAPQLKVSKSYETMLRNYAEGAKSSKADKEALTFVKQKLDAAKWFIDAIYQRQQTLMFTMKAILEYQKEYFLTGDETNLKPMILKDIADIVGMDISTISRVANSKFIQTPYGIMSLKYFFSESLSTTDGEEVSTREVKKILEDAIEGEDKKKPLTDQKLTDLLKEKGYNIARRTVAKYREQLNIPVARLRKEL